jgi:hypothetical protein
MCIHSAKENNRKLSDNCYVKKFVQTYTSIHLYNTLVYVTNTCVNATYTVFILFLTLHSEVVKSPNSERDFSMSCAVKSSFKTGLQCPVF